MRNARLKLLRTCGLIILPLFAFALMLASSGSLAAQEVTASISGTVTDPGGLAVAGVVVIAQDEDRGSTFPTNTNAEGFYTLPRLPIGTYMLRLEAAGFKKTARRGILLAMNQSAKLDFRLEIGEVQQTVEVTEAAPLLQTEDAQLGTVIDSRTNTQLPLATRNYVQLTLLAPGAVTTNAGGFKGAMTTFDSSRPFINGNREQTNNFLLDGLDNNQVSDNLVAYAPSVDAIQEFNEITQNASAEFGNFMGGITSVSIKSGTNKLHGSAFEFFRNDKLNANQWSNNFQGVAKAPLRDNMFGGTLGGPAIKDKLFIFGDYQGTRWYNPASTNSTSLFTEKERKGDFSELLSPAYGNKQLYNPNSVNAAGNRAPFAGNIIPTSMFSSAATKILSSQYYPLPTKPGLVNNYLYGSSSHTNDDQGDVKVDWNISDKDKFFGRYSRAHIESPNINTLPLMYNGTGKFDIHNGSLDYTKTFSSSFVNDLRAGVNYTANYTGTSASSLGNLPKAFGIPGVPDSILPWMGLGNNYASGIGNSDGVQLFNDTVIQWEDTGIWSHGTHTVKFGFQQFRLRVDTFYSGNNGKAGSFNFDGQFTGLNSGSPTIGAGEADFLLGMPDTVGVGTNGGTWGQRANIFAAFAQDTWRVSRSLTVNYGVRWELHTPWTEVNNRQANFGLISGQPAIADGPGCSALGGSCKALYKQYNGAYNFQPRIGIAWNPNNGKTVARASFSTSSFLEGTGTNLRLTINPPFSSEKNAVYNTAAYSLPGSTLDQGYTPIASSSDPYKGANLHVWDPNVRPAVSLQWNVSLQQQLTNTSTLQVAYVGQKNDHLVVAEPYMQKQMTWQGTILPSPYLSGNPSLVNDIGQISGTASSGNQSYNALQVVLKQNLRNGLNGQFAYTYSKCMTDSTGFYGSGGNQSSGQSPYMQNLYDRKGEWGACGWDLTQVASGYLTYDLPFGHGKRFGNNLNKYADAVVGNWQLSTIVQVHNGFPLTISSWSDSSGTGSRGPRADCPSTIVKNGRQNASASMGGGYQWFPSDEFTQPASGSFGTCGVSVIRGPGQVSTDMNLSKKFTIKEQQTLELRSEFINVLNHPILNAPGTYVGSTDGLLQSSQGARNIQFGLKYSF